MPNWMTMIDLVWMRDYQYPDYLSYAESIEDYRIMYNDEMRLEWIDALRSNRYRQTTMSLCVPTTDSDGMIDYCDFCAIGVLLDVYDPRGWDEEWFYNNRDINNYLSHTWSDNELIDDVVAQTQFGMSLWQQQIISGLNDAGISFDIIASFLEVNDIRNFPKVITDELGEISEGTMASIIKTLNTQNRINKTIK